MEPRRERLTLTDDTGAATAIFDRRMTERSRVRYRMVLNAAIGLDRFCADDVARVAGGGPYYNHASQLIRCLREEGAIRQVTPTSGPGSKPKYYRWNDDQEDQ